ncbi:MAG: Uncharacterised protein [Prochlorococcus marinus str. MIT 9215]|nr:MAG: Uncharacterised protein [Prochlorococcus marinus str. MIT 9215]
METDLSIEVAKPILLTLMIVVAGAATYLTRALNTLIRPISRQLIELHKGNNERLEPRLQNIKDRYIELMPHADNIDTAEFSAGEIERLSLRILGREITAASAHSWIHQAPGILISLGLLGTFWGLTVGLGKISGALAPGATPEQTMTALSAIVAPMGTAFQTSLIGLLLSLVVLITSQLFGARTCLERCESLLSSWLETVLPKELEESLMSPLKKSIDVLNKTTRALPSDISASVEKAMKEALAEKLEKMFNISSTIALEAQQATRQLSAVASNLSESGQDFVMAARAFQQSKFPEALRESVSSLLEAKERMTTSSEELNAQMQELRDSLLLMQSQWQLLAKSAEAELETCRLATQQMNEGLTQLQTSSQQLGEGVEVTAVVAKQLRETRLEVMRDRKLSINVAESVRERLAVDSSISETCQVFAQSLETALKQWNNNVNQLDSLRDQFIQVAINGRNEDEAKVQNLAGKAQELIQSINTSLTNDLSQAISIQREALNQLDGPMGNVQQITTDLVKQLETLKVQLDQQSSKSRRRLFWGQGGES